MTTQKRKTTLSTKKASSKGKQTQPKASGISMGLPAKHKNPDVVIERKAKLASPGRTKKPQSFEVG